MVKYTKTISFEEVQSLGYELLKEFDTFSKEHGLTYFLSGGSCLGAIRHQDFIPWDDDIDVCMLRKDYDKLLSIVKRHREIPGKEEFKFFLPLDQNYIYPYAKLVNTDTIVYEKDIQQKFATGVWMDIFPMDVWPDDKKELKRIMQKHNFYKMMNKIYVAGNLSSVKKKILAIIGKAGYKLLFPKKDYLYWNRKIIELVRPCNGTYVGDRIWPVKDKEFFSKKVFEKPVYKKFRDQEFPVPAGYEEYLTKMYGNYMQLPKEKDRVYHDFKGYKK